LTEETQYKQEYVKCIKYTKPAQLIQQQEFNLAISKILKELLTDVTDGRVLAVAIERETIDIFDEGNPAQTKTVPSGIEHIEITRRRG